MLLMNRVTEKVREGGMEEMTMLCIFQERVRIDQKDYADDKSFYIGHACWWFISIMYK